MRSDAPDLLALDGVRDPDEAFRRAAYRADVRHLRVVRLRHQLPMLAEMPLLESLHLVDPESLEELERFRGISSLTLYHLPRVHSLAPIGALTQLRELVLSTPPSYDASRKCHDVESLEPLRELSSLERLVLRGIRPRSGRLEPLHTLSGLRRLAIDHEFVFGLEDYARLARALPTARGHCLVPWFEATWAGVCRKCGGARVALTAPPPRTPRTLCPRCSAARLARHVARWEAVVARG